MPDDECDPVADELVGDRHALLRVGHVVARLELELLAQDAASLVDVLDRLPDALAQLCAEGRIRAGDRPGDADLDLGVSSGRKQKGERDGKRFEDVCPHNYPPIMQLSVSEGEASGASITCKDAIDG